VKLSKNYAFCYFKVLTTKPQNYRLYEGAYNNLRWSTEIRWHRNFNLSNY